MSRASAMSGVLALAAALSLVGCAHLPGFGVPIESRPTPAQPPAPSGDAKVAPTEPVKVEGVLSDKERRELLSRVTADTTAASSAVRGCQGRRLLPDQESVVEATASLLADVRAALARDELWRAESLARKARQLATSINCP
ncbi:MAG: hypothetical protein A2W00_02285 [Candidatus Eisenbacteria bacterium RBG_16_71_46]|nr:MAG: hypothetical protein A2W00_02285 [Candidatus Eisenbacteria bacterium RBG_16_71_46]